MASDRDETLRHTAQLGATIATGAAAGTRTAAGVAEITGVWKLVGGSMRDPDGHVVGVPYGPRGMGLVSLTSDGRMMAVLIDGRAELPEGAKREYSSYCGNYTFDGTTLITTVDASSDPARLASQQVRKVRLEGERMILVPPERDEGGVRIHRELIWARISSISL